MQHRFLICAVAAILAICPALADNTNTTTVNPTNSLTVSPTTNQAATTSNVSTQVYNQNLGSNSYGGGISCQSPQIAIGGYGSRQTAGAALNNSNTGISVSYLAPVGAEASKSCAAIAHEVLKARRLDNSFTMIQKCVDFAKSGVVLDPKIYPELANACSGVHVATLVPATSTSSSSLPTTGTVIGKTQLALVGMRPIHFSDFSPEHNSELRRIAMHRMQRLAMLEMRSHHMRNHHQRQIVAAHIRHEDAHLRAVIAEYDLENAFLRRLLKDQSWRAHNGLRERILSYNDVAPSKLR